MNEGALHVAIVQICSAVSKRTTPHRYLLTAHNIIAIHSSKFAVNFRWVFTHSMQKSYHTSHFNLCPLFYGGSHLCCDVTKACAELLLSFFLATSDTPYHVSDIAIAQHIIKNT